eukprot:SAG22_NODE_1610_length_4002_cov_2.012298_1_plen_530_part_00
MLALLVLFVLFLALMRITAWYRATTLVRDAIDVIRDLSLGELAKIWVVLVQILGTLPRVLSLHLPQGFKDMLNFLASLVQPFQLLSLVGIGCMTHGLYLPSLLANLALVAVMLGGVVLVYMYQVAAARRDDLRGTISAKTLQNMDFLDDGDVLRIAASQAHAILEKLEVDPTAYESMLDDIFNTDPDVFESEDGEANTDADGKITYEALADAMNSSSQSAKLVKATTQFRLATAWADLIGRAFLLVFLLYPPITSKIFEAFHCQQIGPDESILISDHTIHCTLGGSLTVEYISLNSFVLVLVFAWPIGVPTFLALTMWQAQDKIARKDPETMKMFDFVIGTYKDEAWYWEVVEFGRKLILAGLIGFLGRGTVVQIVTAQFVSFFFFAAQFRVQPFLVPMLNVVKSCSEFIIFGVLVVCTVQEVATTEFEEEAVSIDDYGSFQIGLCVTLIPVTIIFMAFHIRDMRRIAKGKARDKEAVAESPLFSNSSFEFENPLEEGRAASPRTPDGASQDFENPAGLEFENPVNTSE